MANPVTWFEIYVKDMERAKAFYEKTLGIKLSKLETPTTDVTEMWSFPMGDLDRSNNLSRACIADLSCRS